MTRAVTLAKIGPLAVRRDEAAALIGVGPTKFDDLVKDGRMPKPVKVDGCTLWDVAALKAAWAALAGTEPVDSGAGWHARSGL